MSSSEGVKDLLNYATKNRMTTGHWTIADEKKHNIFMMLDDPEIQKATGETDSAGVMAKLRELKNKF